MTIDTTGRWWVGTEAADIRSFLINYKAEGYEVDETRISKCGCGSDRFNFEADRNEGAAKRVCVDCGGEQLMFDSAEYWDEAEPEKWQCTECGCDVCNLGAGFSLYVSEDDNARDVRWLSIGNRCNNCGVLGSFLRWKVGYGPSNHLLEQA